MTHPRHPLQDALEALEYAKQVIGHPDDAGMKIMDDALTTLRALLAGGKMPDLDGDAVRLALLFKSEDKKSEELFFPRMKEMLQKYYAAGLAAGGKDEARTVLEALVKQIEVCHQDEKYQGVWQIAYVHGLKYDGPQYADQLNAAKAFLAGSPHTPPQQADMVLVPKSALDWLFGEGPDANGEYFHSPTNAPPYWWRSHFCKLIAAARKDGA